MQRVGQKNAPGVDLGGGSVGDMLAMWRTADAAYISFSSVALPMVGRSSILCTRE